MLRAGAKITGWATHILLELLCYHVIRWNYRKDSAFNHAKTP
jgi:hypothetical protein